MKKVAVIYSLYNEQEHGLLEKLKEENFEFICNGDSTLIYHKNFPKSKGRMPGGIISHHQHHPLFGMNVSLELTVNEAWQENPLREFVKKYQHYFFCEFVSPVGHPGFEPE